jgi:putative DNA primase/helicase
MSNLDVSLFTSATNPVPHETLALHAMCERIRTGAYSTRVGYVRKQLAYGKERYQQAKKSLPGFTPAGTFTHRANAHLGQATNLVHYDLDGVSDVAAAKALLADDPYVLYAFVSPGGDGVKFAIATDATIEDDQAYKHAWQTVLAHLQAHFPGLTVSTDTGCKDIARLCFVSHDPELYTNSGAIPFHVSPYTPPHPKPQPRRPFTATGDEYERARAALNCVPADDRETWLKVGMGLHHSGESWARDLWDSWASRSVKFNERDQEQTWRGFKAEGGVTMGTVVELAKRHGYQPERRNGHTAKPQAALGASAVSDDERVKVDIAVPYSDVWNAEHLVKAHGQDLRYVYAWKKWLVWNGTCWEVDGDGAAMARARETIKALLPQAGAWLEQAALSGDAKEMKQAQAFYAHLASSLRDGRLKDMLSQAQSENGIPVKPEALDKDPWLLNCANGTLDLRTGTLRPHDREDMYTRCLEVAFDAAAQCPTWEAFLSTIMNGNENLIGFLQRAVGYALTGVIREHVLPILWGKGRNGKSTFLNTIRALLGPYAMKAPSELLMVSNSDRHPTERADLYGKRFVAAIETEQGRRLAEVFVKEATGGDPIRARRMREDFWEFDPTHKVFLATNHKPTIKGTDHAIWERIKLVPFTVTISPEDIDTALPEKLMAELPGILNWAVQGCLDWQTEGLCYPDEVKEFTAGYREEMDVLAHFIDECCVLLPHGTVKATALATAYQAWARSAGETPMGNLPFIDAMEERGYVRKRGHANQYYWHGIGLADTTEERVY